MSQFVPAHLGKWEPLFRDLLEGDTMPLNDEGVWMLGDKPGLVAIFEDGEPVYLTSSSGIARTLATFIKGGAECEFRTLVATVDLGASAKTAAERAREGPLAQRINKRVAKMRYRVAPGPAAQLEPLAAAFTVVADPRYNGLTARANRALDALPQ